MGLILLFKVLGMNGVAVIFIYLDWFLLEWKNTLLKILCLVVLDAH